MNNNAKEELLDVLNCPAASGIKCAYIEYEAGWDEPRTIITLKVDHNQEDLEQFLDKLDFNYDSGFGSQQLFGVVWLEDDTWLSRGEYDGSEWWKHNKLPKIPKDCLN